MSEAGALRRARWEAELAAAAEETRRLRDAVERLDASDPQRAPLERMLADARAARDRLAGR